MNPSFVWTLQSPTDLLADGLWEVSARPCSLAASAQGTLRAQINSQFLGTHQELRGCPVPRFAGTCLPSATTRIPRVFRILSQAAHTEVCSNFRVWKYCLRAIVRSHNVHNDRWYILQGLPELVRVGNTSQRLPQEPVNFRPDAQRLHTSLCQVAPWTKRPSRPVRPPPATQSCRLSALRKPPAKRRAKHSHLTTHLSDTSRSTNLRLYVSHKQNRTKTCA